MGAIAAATASCGARFFARHLRGWFSFGGCITTGLNPPFHRRLIGLAGKGLRLDEMGGFPLVRRESAQLQINKVHLISGRLER